MCRATCRHLWVFGWVAGLLGCSEGTETKHAVEPPSACASHELLVPDGTCIAPGIGADGCADGFEADPHLGCRPILPDDSCPPHQMALPGEGDCRPVMACGEGRWGDLSVDGATVYVDASYTGGSEDGSAEHPFTTLSAAVASVSPNGLVAVAAGTYEEDLVITGKAVRIWGVCPELVTLRTTGSQSTGCSAGAVCIGLGAEGTEIGGVTLTGPGRGITVANVADVIVDRVVVHDTERRGVLMQQLSVDTSVTLRNSLVSGARLHGVLGAGGTLTVESSVIENITADPGGLLGRGIEISVACVETDTSDLDCSPHPAASLHLHRSVVQGARDLGLLIRGATASVEESVVRHTLPRVLDERSGRGVSVESVCGHAGDGVDCGGET